MNLKKSILAVALLTMMSCGSSVESEQATWQQKKEILTEYSASYPVWESEIKAQFGVAETAMEAALQISDEDEKIDAMQAANKLAFKGTIDNLLSLENALDAVHNEVKKIRDNLTSKQFTKKTNYLLDEAASVIYNAEMSLTSYNNDLAYASKVFEQETEKLKDIESSLRKHYLEVKSKRKKSKKSKAAEDKNSNKIVAPIPNISCQKCGGKVKSGKVKCGNCGAPIKK